MSVFPLPDAHFWREENFQHRLRTRELQYRKLQQNFEERGLGLGLSRYLLDQYPWEPITRGSGYMLETRVLLDTYGENMDGLQFPYAVNHPFDNALDELAAHGYFDEYHEQQKINDPDDEVGWYDRGYPDALIPEDVRNLEVTQRSEHSIKMYAKDLEDAKRNAIPYMVKKARELRAHTNRPRTLIGAAFSDRDEPSALDRREETQIRRTLNAAMREHFPPKYPDIPESSDTHSLLPLAPEPINFV